MKMCKLSLGEAQHFYAVHQGKAFYDTLTQFMSSGRVVAMELVRDGEHHPAFAMIMRRATSWQQDIQLACSLVVACLHTLVPVQANHSVKRSTRELG